MADGKDPAFVLLLCCLPGVSREQLSVDLSATHDRLPHSEAPLEESIERIWAERSAKNTSLFNGSKFRYGGYEMIKDEKGTPKLCLLLGLTDYKTFVGTNLSPDWERFLKPDPDDVAKCLHTASPLGNGAVVETKDSKIIVLQRSGNVGEFPDSFAFPGGHSEPEQVGLHGHGDLEPSKKQELNGKIVDEMFQGVVREVCEETGVPETSLSQVRLIGISRRIINARPAAFFYMKCNLKSDEVHEHYRNAVDASESTKLRCLTMDELEMQVGQMPGCHQGGAALFKLMNSN